MKPGAAAAFIAILQMPVFIASADGRLPPRPYHYLRPPGALARDNVQPSSGETTVPVSGGRSTRSFFVFTHDGQEGLQATAGALTIDRSIHRLQIRIDPVKSPSGLPRRLLADGNAYRISAAGVPGKRPASVVRALRLYLRWPHIPAAVYVYQGHQWRPVCNSANWSLSLSAVSCSVSGLGTFLAVTGGQ